MSGDAKAEYLQSDGYGFSSSIQLTLKPKKHISIVIPFSCKNDGKYEMEKIKYNIKLDKIRYAITLDPVAGQITDSKLTGNNWSIDLVKAYMYGEYAVSNWDYVYSVSAEEFRSVLFNNTTGKKKKKDGMTFRYNDYSVSLSNDDLCFQTAPIKIGSFSLRSSVIAQVMDGSGINRSVSASVDINPIEDVDFYIAFDSRKTKTFNFDTVARFSSNNLDFEFYYASKTTRPSGSSAYNEYMSFFCSLELKEMRFHFGMKDLMKTNKVKCLCLGATFENDSVEADVSCIYNMDKKILVLGCKAMLSDIIPDISFIAGANLWNKEEQRLLTGKIGVGYYSKDYGINVDVSFLKQVDAPLCFGVGAGMKFKTLVKGVRLEASYTLDPFNAAGLATIAESGRKSYSDAMPRSYSNGAKSFSVRCTYTF